MMHMNEMRNHESKESVTNSDARTMKIQSRG